MIKLLLKPIREGIGRIIVLGDYLTRTKQVTRDEKTQQLVDLECKNLSLYQFYACPFCVKVRRNIHKLALNVTYKNAKQEDIRQELLTRGGKIQVPCLQIKSASGDKYIYESNDVIQYLNDRFR